MTERQQALDFGSAHLRHKQHDAPVDERVLEHLRELNRNFVDLLGAEGRGVRDGEDIRDEAANHRDSRVVNLDSAQRSILADCPFSLFNARFQDSQFWSGVSQGNAGNETAAKLSYRHTGEPFLGGFTEMILFYAWHLVQANPLAAQIILGMSAQTVNAFKRLTLARLRQTADAYRDLAAPRWPQRAPFWQGLLDAVLHGQQQRLIEMRSLGIQLIAAELGRS